MTTDHPPRVAIFQYRWPLQSQTVNMVHTFLANSWAVDVFLSDVSETLQHLSHNTRNLRIFDFSELGQATVPHTGQPPAPRSIRQHLRAWLLMRPAMYRIWRQVRSPQEQAIENVKYFLGSNDLTVMLPPTIVERSLSIIQSTQYAAFIGVESMGLVWAGVIAQHFTSPLLFYSLELYTKDYPLRQGRVYVRIKRLESRFHRQAAATIIQDKERAEIILKDNGVHEGNLLFVPVGLLGPPVQQKSDLLRRMLNIAPDKRIILIFGLMKRRRFTPELVRLAQSFPEDWVLVAHGELAADEPDIGDHLQQMNAQQRAIISTELVPPDKIDDLVSSADIGIVLYSSETKNEWLTGRSSEKAALYAKAGVPMIAFSYPTFTEVFEQYHCGVCVDSLDDLPGAVRTILQQYEYYRSGAYQAYAEVYEFSRPFMAVIQWIKEYQLRGS